MPSLDASCVSQPDEPLPDALAALAALAAHTLSDQQRATAILQQDRHDRSVTSETAIDEALEMTFPASDPVAL